MGETMELALVVARINREDCKQTKHDSQFSKWQVLIGPSDWEDYSLGKEGAARYRVHNLPVPTGPGVYELGVSRTGSGRDANKLDSDGVVVVYLGQADSVRARLQRYGRTGAHLNDCDTLKKGSVCFEDLFRKGYSIVYRWIPMKNKEDALKKEAEFLNRFDYAWNKGSNGQRRHNDVLQKLNKAASRNNRKTIRELQYFSREPGSIKIKASKLPLTGIKFSEDIHNFFPQVFKFSKSQPRLVLDSHGDDKDYTDSNSSVSVNREFKGHRAEKCRVGEGFTPICSIPLDDGSFCRAQPVKGNKRCENHKWRKSDGSKSKTVGTPTPLYLHDVVFDNKHSSEMYKPGIIQPRLFSKNSAVNSHYNTVCGVEFHNGYMCTRQPVAGRVRCEEHKGLRIDGIISKPFTKYESHVYIDSKYSPSVTVCGAVTLTGSYCRRPVNGKNTRCWQHSVSDMSSTTSRYNDRKYGETSICGAPTRNGSYCRRSVKGGGRCYQH